MIDVRNTDSPAQDGSVPASGALDPGQVRSTARVLSDDGFFLVLAVDHLAEFTEVIGTPGDVPFERIARAKEQVIRAGAPVSSGVLVDARLGLGQAVLTGAIPPATGVIAAVEAENYEFPVGPRESILLDGWSPRAARRAGADMLKLLWFYRPDLDQDIAARQRDTLIRIAEESREAGLELVVEPIWYAVGGEDARSDAWQRRRAEGIVASAATAQELGASVLKIEFPGRIDTFAERKASAAQCALIDAELDVPWVLLSAGVTHDQFAVQLEIAARAGASGYMAGRSVWRDLFTASGSADLLRERLEQLNGIVRAHGRPYDVRWRSETAVERLPRDWYTHL